jgi:hypothetical protein
MADGYLTPPELAKRWRCKPAKILGFLRNGELRGFDISSSGTSRPRWRISLGAVVEFENRRAAKPAVKPMRRRKRDAQVIEFFT